jgi:anti-sigma regulatory factor (Ser/Thr protein kinase)
MELLTMPERQQLGLDAGSRTDLPTQVSDWPLRTYLELSALPTAASYGRRHTRQVLREWHLDHLADDAATLVSELLTNAVKASESARGAGLVTLRLLADRARLLIEVWDQHPADPQPREADDESECGRGFTVIEAISHRWGFRRTRHSQKVVWCELLTCRQA